MTTDTAPGLRAALVEAQRIVKLADDLTHAVDLEAEDIGTGPRSSLVILQEMGPLIAPALRAIDAALSAEPAVGVVYCILCIEPIHHSETLHIFSTPEQRQEFMHHDQRNHVAYDYVLDAPERHEEPIHDH